MKPNTVSMFFVAASSFTVGYVYAPREILDTEVKQAGLFSVETRDILSATVLSLQAENKLLVYRYKGDARVSVRRESFWGLLDARQQLIVPATVGYYIDLAKLSFDDVTLDEKANVVTVRLPPLEMGDVAFQPEKAVTANGGLLTFSQEVVDELARTNYALARRAFVKQAQGASIVQIARHQAEENVSSYFGLALRVAGKNDLNVKVIFRKT